MYILLSGWDEELPRQRLREFQRGEGRGGGEKKGETGRGEESPQSRDDGRDSLRGGKVGETSVKQR